MYVLVEWFSKDRQVSKNSQVDNCSNYCTAERQKPLKKLYRVVFVGVHIRTGNKARYTQTYATYRISTPGQHLGAL
jgi:hypothetical protein